MNYAKIAAILDRLFEIQSQMAQLEDDLLNAELYKNVKKEKLIKQAQIVVNKDFQEELSKLVDVDFICEKFSADIGDWLEENDPDNIVHRAERIEKEMEQERYENMTKAELKREQEEYEANIKEEK